MTEWIWESVVDCARAVRERRVSSRELVEAAWAQIERVNPALNALVTARHEASLRDADEADRALRSGDPIGPLCGIPMTIKDSFDTCDLVTTWGTPGRARFVPKRDATVVRRLREAGAVLLGKTNTPELTLSFHTRNALFGDTRNPYALEHSPGGSSGGAAALVAAGGCAFDVGSDTGGSIRLPAHFCGIAGLRPTSGRVPRTGHAIGAGGPLERLTQVGPLARRVEDLALLLDVLAGPDGEDPSIAPVPLRPMSMDPKSCSGLRVRFHTDNGLATPTLETRAAVVSAARALEGAGAIVTEGTPAGLELTPGLFARLMTYDGGAWIHRLLASAGTLQEDSSLAHLRALKPTTAADVSDLLEQWDRFRSEMLGVFDDCDALLCPVNAGVAPPLEQPESPFLAYTYTTAYNLTGWPAAVVRAAGSPEGLPIGVQVVAPPWREDLCLSLAWQIEAVSGGHVPPRL